MKNYNYSYEDLSKYAIIHENVNNIVRFNTYLNIVLFILFVVSFIFAIIIFPVQLLIPVIILNFIFSALILSIISSIFSKKIIVEGKIYYISRHTANFITIKEQNIPEDHIAFDIYQQIKNSNRSAFVFEKYILENCLKERFTL